MKKLKKVLLSLCLILCLGFVGIGATACTASDVSLNEEQTKKLLQVVENGDEFMKKTLDILQSETNKMEKEEVYGLFQTAFLKVYTNYDNCWDNMKIHTEGSSSRGGSGSYDILSYKKDGMNYLIYHDDEILQIVLGDNGNLTRPSVGENEAVGQHVTGNHSEYNNDGTDKSFTRKDGSLTYQTTFLLGNTTLFDLFLNFEENDILSYKQENNGDITVVARYQVLGELICYGEFVISNGNLKSYTAQLMVGGKIYAPSTESEEESSQPLTMSGCIDASTINVTFSFGTLQNSDVKPYFDEMNAYIASQRG